MKCFRIALAVSALAMATFAHAAPPSDESLDKLLVLMQSERQLQQSVKQVDEMIRLNAEQAQKGKKLGTREQEIFDETRAQLTALFRSELSWKAMEPTFRKIYGESFSQEEVDGMIAFYQTPVGKAVIEKMPKVTQSTMVLMQEKMTALMPKVQKIQQETQAKLKDAGGK